jgi:hypothetical protein
VSTWYHVAAVYNGTTLIIYINGVSEDVTIASGSITANVQDVTIDCDGSVALPMIYNAGLSSTRISEISVAKDPSLYNQTNLVMGLPFNAGSSSPNDDTTSNSNDATLQGSSGYTGEQLDIEQVSGPVEDQYNTFGFDNLTSKNVTAQYDNTMGLHTSTWSVHFRVNIDNQNYNGFFQYFIDITSRLQIYGDVNGRLWFYFVENNSAYGYLRSTNQVFTNGQNHSVTITRNGATLTMYVDGVSVPTTVINAMTANNISSTTNDITFGGVEFSSGGDQEVDGDMTTLSIWSRELTATEALNLHQSNKAPYYSTWPSSLKVDNGLYWELSSRDDSANDLSGNGNNGTKNGGVGATGELLTFAPYN